MRRLRLAFFSPLNPQKSGVSDYTEELLPHLAERADVDLVIGPYRPSNPEITRRFRLLPADEFLASRSRYDMAVYQLANNFEQHGYMIPCMRAFPGVSMFQDYHLHFLMFGLTLMRGDPGALERSMRPRYGAATGRLVRRCLLSLEDPYGLSMVGPLIDASRVIVTHCEIGREMIVTDRPAARVRVFPMGMPPNPAVARRAEARAKHGIAENEFVLASVSTLSYTKRLDVALSAVSALRERCPRLRMLIMGGGRLGQAAQQAIGRHGLEACVRLTGWTPPETYAELLAAADAVIDLRYPSGGETAASLLRAIASGKPAVVSAHGSFLELPDSVAHKIDVGPNEVTQIAEAIARLVEDEPRRQAMSRAAFQYAATTLSLDRAAEGYLAAAREAMALPSPPESVLDLATPMSGVKRTFYAWLYRAFRMGYLYRHYGAAQTLARLRAAAAGAGA